MASERAIKQILVKVSGYDGARYALALCTDGSYGIIRNNILLQQSWPTDDDLEDCVNAMMACAGLARDAHFA